MKRSKVERLWVVHLHFEFNKDPSITHCAFNMALIVFEADLSNSHMLSNKITV